MIHIGRFFPVFHLLLFILVVFFQTSYSVGQQTLPTTTPNAPTAIGNLPTGSDGSGPPPAGVTEIKIGLLLPYSQGADFGTEDLTISGTSAIRLAFKEINEGQQLLPGAWLTAVQQDSFGASANQSAHMTSSGAQAIYGTMALEQSGVVSVIGDVTSSQTVFSALITSKLQIPQCSYSAGSSELSNKGDYSTFFRTIPSNIAFANVMVDIAHDRGWNRYGILHTADTLGQQMSSAASSRGRDLGLQLVRTQLFFEQGEGSNLRVPLQNLMDANVRVIILGAVGPEQIEILTMAASMKMTGEFGYVWIVINNVIEDLRPNFPDDSFNSTWQGLIMVDNLLELKGDPEYESFLDKWAQLDPKQFPKAGSRSITSNEGLAYSCAMVLARGFSQTIQSFADKKQALADLAGGRMGANFTLNTWNTGYEGPGGPMQFDENGDVKQGNFRVLNFHGGIADNVGTSQAGIVNFQKRLIFFDGTSNTPSDSPPSQNINISWQSTPASLILFIVSFMMVACLIVTAIVITNRKVKMFKAASPSFCIMELAGLFLAYCWVLLQIGIPSTAMCWIKPMLLVAAYVLVLGGIVVKNQRIYKIFDNVYAATSARIVIKDYQLARVCGTLLLIDLSLVTIMLALDMPAPTTMKLSDTQHSVVCSAGKSTPGLVFTVFLVLFNAFLLGYAIFLSYRTRNVAGTFSECKQIALSVYNIFLCTLVAAPTQFISPNEYYAGFYLRVLAVWVGSTFTLVVLFGPKLWQFFTLRASGRLYGESSTSRSGQFWMGTGISGSSSGRNVLDLGFGVGLTANGIGSNRESTATILGKTSGKQGSGDRSPTSPTGPLEKSLNLQAYEGILPMKRVFRGFPFLSKLTSWEMKKVIVIPATRYFSVIGANRRASTFAYISAQPLPHGRNGTNEPWYGFKTTGRGWSDFIFQVQSRNALDHWCRWFGGNENGGMGVGNFQLTKETSVTCFSNSIGTKDSIKQAAKRSDDFHYNALASPTSPSTPTAHEGFFELALPNRSI